MKNEFKAFVMKEEGWVNGRIRSFLGLLVVSGVFERGCDYMFNIGSMSFVGRKGWVRRGFISMRSNSCNCTHLSEMCLRTL